jgi:hypothetical protein
VPEERDEHLHLLFIDEYRLTRSMVTQSGERAR